MPVDTLRAPHRADLGCASTSGGPTGGGAGDSSRKMGPTGHLVTIKRNGVDGPHFPLSLSTCLFGRGIECDIRIQLPVVSKQHCKIEISEQKAILFNFSSTYPTQVNGSAIDDPVQLKHGDVITIVDRSFRYENESRRDGSKSTEFPGQRREQASPRRVSRSGFPSTPDGRVQDPKAGSKLTEESVSGRPLARVGAATAALPIARAPEEPVASKTPSAHAPDLPGDKRRNAAGATAGDSKEDSSVTFPGQNGEVKSCPSIQRLENSGEDESPFRKLYESMKEELDVKSEKENLPQTRRKSGSRSHGAAEHERAGASQGATPLLLSLKPRRRSDRSTQIQANPASGAQGRGQADGQRADEASVPTPRGTVSPSGPPTEGTKTKARAQCSHQSPSPRCRRGDLSVSSGSGSVNLDQSEGFGADNRTFTPRKSLTRNQTPAKVENADNFGNTPEKVFSRKRRRSSIPPNVDILTIEAELQKQTALAPLLIQVERKVPDSSLGSPEPVGATAGQRCPGSPGLRSVDVSNFGDSINTIEGMPLKRRRVSFGGHLRPELFDENLPPNTPLKRGETPVKRRSLVTHTPAVLKKIIKEQLPPSGNEDSSSGIHPGVTAQKALLSSPARNPVKTPAAGDGRRRSPEPSPASRGLKSPQGTDIPKRGGRRSSSGPPKRTSVDRSQQELLQMIHSKRRSGASGANLVVAKSWADVVKLSAKQAQTKVAKLGPRRQLNKRQRRTNTPKRPAGGVHNQFSTGHANSPYTIIIGKAHIEKVNVPARPYRMLNNLVFDKKISFNEDLSGLTEMFKTPAKEKPQLMSVCPSTFSNSEDLLKKKFQVPNSEEKPLLCTSDNFGENVFPSTQNAPEQMSKKSSASPALRRQCFIVNENMKTPPCEAAPQKAASSANKFRRSVERRNTQMPGAQCENEGVEANAVENILERRLRKTPQREENLEEEMKESERSFETCKKNIESKENSEKMIAVRRSKRSSELKCAPEADPIALKRQQETEPTGARVDTHSALRTPGHTKEPVELENRTTVKHCPTPRSEPVSTPVKVSTRTKTPSKAVSGEALSAVGKPTQAPGEATCSHREPAGDAKDIKAFKETPEQKLDPAENVTGGRRRSRTPNRKVQPLEELARIKELFQSPDHTVEPVTGDRTKIPCKSPKVEPVNTPTSRKSRLKTPVGKVGAEEELSALRKPTQTPGEATCSHGEPAGDAKDIKAFKETPEQKLDPIENVTGSNGRSRTPKRRVQALEELPRIQELFQTPDHTVEPVTGDKTTKMLCKSPQPEPVVISTSVTRRLKTPPRKVDGEEELSALRASTRTPGGTPCSPREPAGDDKIIEFFKETPEQKLDSAENVTGSRRRSRTPRRQVQPLEDLVGFKELVQTPDHTVEPVTGDRTKIPSKSPKLEPVNMPTNRKSRLKTSVGKVGAEEELSALRKPTQTPGEATCSHGEPAGDDQSIKAFKETPEQKLDSAENVTGGRRRSRTPKRRVQPLEDLAGFKELVQTPQHAMEPATGDKTTVMLCKSPQPEPVGISTSVTRQLKTPPWKVDGEEELSALRASTRTPGGTPCSPREPAGDDKTIEFFKETPEQKLDSEENVTRSRRRSQTPKRKVQPLEDLVGFKELVQTPDHTVEPVIGDRTKIPSKSPKPEPVDTPSRKSCLKTPVGKVGAEEELSALRKPTQTPGEATCSHGEPAGDAKDIKAFKETPEQKLDSAENVTGGRRRSRTPKRRVQPLEDLAGFKELVQTPQHAVEPVTGDKTTVMLCKSSQPEPVGISTSVTRRLKTPLRKVDGEEELSALGESTRTPRGTTCFPREPAGDDKIIEFFKETPEQKLDSAENVTGGRRRSRTPRRQVQPLEDLVGFKELFQTPDHTVEPVTGDKTTKMRHRSLQAEPVNTPTSRKSRLKTPVGKVGAEEELSALRKPTQTPGEATCSHGEPAGDDQSIKAFKETPEQKLDSGENVTGGRRRSRTPKRRVQPLEDLVGFKELFQTPDHTVEPVTGDRTKIPSKSPKLEPVNMPTNRKRCLKTSVGKVDGEEELSALRKPTQTPGEATCSHREPAGDDKIIETFKETPEQKLDSAENVTGGRRRSRTPKRKVQPLEDLVGFKELFQTPDHTVEPVTGDKTTKMPRESPQAGVVMPTGRKSRLKAPPGKVELSALRKPTWTVRSTRSHRKPEGDGKDITLFKETADQKLDPAEHGTRSKRKPTTPKGKAQPLGDPAGLKEQFQTPDHTDDPVTEDKTTGMPCQSPQPEAAIAPASKKRRLKAPPGRADGEDGPSALRKSTRTGRSTRSHREPVDGHKDVSVCEQTARQKPGPAENAAGSKRQLRTRKEKAPPPKGPAACQELFQTTDQDKELGNDAETVERTPTPTPDRRKPVKTSRRVLRAPHVTPMGDLAGSRDPVKSQRESSVPPSPKRKRGKEGSVTGRKRLRPMTCPQGTAQQTPLPERQGTAPGDSCQPPEPLIVKKKSQRVWAGRAEPVGDLPSNNLKTKHEGRKDATSPDKGMSLRSRRPNKTNGAEQRPEFLVSAEKIKIKKNEKMALHTSREAKPQHLEEAAKNSPSGGQVRARRACPRPGRQRAVPVPSVAEEKVREKGAETHVRKTTREGKEGAARPGLMCLRSRKVTVPPTGDTLENESKPRVTRSARRPADNLKKENDNVCIKKIRTRSHRDGADI